MSKRLRDVITIFSERDELRRSIQRYHELTQPHAVLSLLQRVEELERAVSALPAHPEPAPVVTGSECDLT